MNNQIILKDFFPLFINRKVTVIILFLGAFLWFIAASPFVSSAPCQTQKITTSLGREITFDKPFKKIISLYSAHTENLCSLGAQSLLVGISKTDDYPEDILTKPRFSYRDDPEKFIRLQPDLVLIRPMIARSYPQFIKKLQRANIVVISLQPNNINEMFDYWKTLGILCGLENQADLLIKQFKEKLTKVRKEVQKIPLSKRPNVYFQSIHTKMKTFAPDSIGIFVLEEAGGVNIGFDAIQMRKTNIAYYGKERLLSKGGDIDIFIAQHGRMNPVDKETIINEPGFQAIKAVRENNIFLVEEPLVSRPTMRILEGIEQLYNIFYNNPQNINFKN